MHYMRKFFETTGQIDHSHVGTGEFELDVAGGEGGWSPRRCTTPTRPYYS
jgi:hypothetical protein